LASITTPCVLPPRPFRGGGKGGAAGVLLEGVQQCANSFDRQAMAGDRRGKGAKTCRRPRIDLVGDVVAIRAQR